MRRSSLVEHMLGFIVVLLGAAVAMRWIYDLLRPLLWLFVVVSVLVLTGMVWSRWGSGRW